MEQDRRSLNTCFIKEWRRIQHKILARFRSPTTTKMISKTFSFLFEKDGTDEMFESVVRVMRGTRMLDPSVVLPE
jgi:hypothetical protein